MRLIVALVLIAVAIAASISVVLLSDDHGKDDEPQSEKVEGTLVLTIDGVGIPVVWEDNASVDGIRALAKDGLTVDTHRYGGFEQVGPLGKSIARDDSSMTSSPGDIFLYSGNQIVFFFGENSYSYTPLGRMDLPESEIISLLDKDSATVTLHLD